jgi:hypothetical protein
MPKRKKTIAEINAETKEKMSKIVEIARIHTNVERNIKAIKDNKKFLRRLIRDEKHSKDKDTKKILRFYQEDFKTSIGKLAGFVKEDVSQVKGLLKELELKEHKKRGKRKNGA